MNPAAVVSLLHNNDFSATGRLKRELLAFIGASNYVQLVTARIPA
jgi:hypothetical protein